MPGRLFTGVAPQLWSSERFMALGDAEAKLHLYLTTGPHQNSSGCYHLPDGYAATDLNWTRDKYVSARTKLIKTGMIAYDATTSEVYIERWFEHTFNAPTGPKHAAGVAKWIFAIKSDVLREKVEADFSNTTWGARGIEALTAEREPIPTDNSRLANTRLVRGG